MLKNYVFEKIDYIGKKRIFNNNINYDLESFNKLQVVDDTNYHEQIKELYFNHLDDKYPQLFKKNKKEFKYYICSKNIYIYNEDVITGNTEFEINILISLIIYNYFYEKGADENLYEKIYNDIQLLTRTKTNDCDNKIIITNTIGLNK